MSTAPEAVVSAEARMPTPGEALIRASLTGDFQGAVNAINSGANPNQPIDFGSPERPSKISPIDAAALGESDQILQMLLDKGATLTSSSLGSDAPITFLVLENRPTAISLLVSKGLIPDTLIAELLARLIGTCIDPEFFREERSMLRAQVFRQSNQDISLIDLDRFACLADSPDTPSIASAAQFLKLAAKQLTSETLHTAVTSATRRAITSGDVFLAQLFEKYGATISPDDWQDLVVSASGSGNVPALKIALKQIKDPNRPDSGGQLALVAAGSSGNAATAKLLIGLGANPNGVGKNGEVPLLASIRSDNSELAALLLSTGASVEGTMGADEWPLRSAVIHGRADILRMLLERHANVDRRDSNGRTALHLPDESSVTATHADVVTLLVAAGFNLGATDKFGASTFQQALRTNDPSYFLAKSIYRNGALLNGADIEELLYRDKVELLEWLLRNGLNADSRFGDSSLIERAALHAYTAPDLVRVVIEAGAKIPTDPEWRYSLLMTAIRKDSPSLVAGLLRTGPIRKVNAFLDADPIETAIEYGAADLVAILDQQEEKANATDSSGETAAHRLATADARRRAAGDRPLLDSDQQRALAAAIDVGLDLQAKNSAGLTVTDLASRNAGTAAAIQNAIALAGPPLNAFAAAVRNGSTADIERLIAAGANIDATDSLGRSPLTLALSLGRVDVAALLLRRGALISLVPARRYLRPDTYYASDPMLSAYFRARLLQEQLLNLTPGATATSARALVSSLDATISQSIGSTNWEISCVLYCTAAHISGNKSLAGGAQMDARQWLEGSTTFFEVSRNAPEFNFLVGGGFLGGPYLIKTVWTVTGTLTLPACDGRSTSTTLCYPNVSIRNLSPISESETDNPVVELKIKQGGKTTDLLPGKSADWDRTEGPIDIAVDSFRSSTAFDAKFSVQANAGPPFHANTDISLESRVATYARLAEIELALHDSLLSGADSGSVRTLQTAIRALSASAVVEKFDQEVVQELRRRAEDLSAISDTAADVRKAVVSASSFTEADLDLMLARLKAAKLELGNRDVKLLDALEKDLEDAKTIVGNEGHAAQFLAQHFNSDVDRMIGDYQGLVLELAQYVSADQLLAQSGLSQGVLDAIGRKLAPTDVVISDSAFGGSGSLIRQAFKLPTPPSNKAKQ